MRRKLYLFTLLASVCGLNAGSASAATANHIYHVWDSAQTVYSAPILTAPKVGQLAAGTPIAIRCQVVGDAVLRAKSSLPYWPKRIWDAFKYRGRLAFASDMAFNTPGRELDGYTSGLPYCRYSANVYLVGGIAIEGYSGLNVRGGPSVRTRHVGTLHDGDAVRVVCQTYGGLAMASAHGKLEASSHVWDEITYRKTGLAFIWDWYVDPLHSGTFDPQIRRCHRSTGGAPNGSVTNSFNMAPMAVTN